MILSLTSRKQEKSVMSPEEISLTNSRIRIALKTADTKELAQATMSLCNGDKTNSDQLISWFYEVFDHCKSKRNKIQPRVALMRMWMLDNLNIQNLSETGSPTFSLTKSGSKKIKTYPQNEWLKVLLWDKTQGSNMDNYSHDRYKLSRG